MQKLPQLCSPPSFQDQTSLFHHSEHRYNTPFLSLRTAIPFETHIHLEDGGSKFLQNAGAYLLD